MKKINLLTVLVFSLVIQRVNAQSSSPSNAPNPSYYLGWDATSTIDLPFTAKGLPYQMYLTQAGDLNISNANSYMLGSHSALTMAGDPTSIYVGLTAVPSTSTGLYNACLGNGAGIGISGGSDNTVAGAFAGSTLSSGSQNTLIGSYAGSHLTGNINTMLGDYAGFNSASCNANTFLGVNAGQDNTSGSYNTFTGYDCGYNNETGLGNAYYGKEAGVNNENGIRNCMVGDHAGGFMSGPVYTTDSESFFGPLCAYYFPNGSGNVANVMIGSESGYNQTLPVGGTATFNWNVFVGAQSAFWNPGGTGNIIIGDKSDGYTVSSGGGYGPINYSTAIGFEAVVTQDNSIILGNDNQWTGIGLSYNTSVSGATGYPTNSLEICARYNSGILRPNWSGLRFRNLNSASPFSASEPGVLTLDASGDVVYENTPAAHLGTCSSPTVLSSGEGVIDLNNENFYFNGNGAGSTVNNVGIGLPCSSSLFAKLEVLQASGTPNTIAEYVTNNDLSNGTYMAPQPLIGVKSQIGMPVSSSYYNVAGWFESDGNFHATRRSFGTHCGYAIFVPGQVGLIGSTPIIGGTVSIGYQFSSAPGPQFLLDVAGQCRFTGGWTPSDSILKKNVVPFTYGLKAIRNLNPVSYQYNGIGGFDSSTNYVGLIAQNLARNVPSAVLPTTIVKDTINHDTTTILNIYNQAVMYTAVNAIIQLDSTVSANHKADSIKIENQQQTIDSMRTTLNTLLNCCENRSQVHHNNGNSDDSNAITNVQDVTLSLTSSTPLLFQNDPNPTTGITQIRYYLPAGTQAAEIMFFDTYGKQMKVVQLNQTGNGVLNVTSDNLTAGIYAYSLVVGGTVIDTKRMILQK